MNDHYALLLVPMMDDSREPTIKRKIRAFDEKKKTMSYKQKTSLEDILLIPKTVHVCSIESWFCLLLVNTSSHFGLLKHFHLPG